MALTPKKHKRVRLKPNEKRWLSFGRRSLFRQIAKSNGDGNWQFLLVFIAAWFFLRPAGVAAFSPVWARLYEGKAVYAGMVPGGAVFRLEPASCPQGWFF